MCLYVKLDFEPRILPSHPVEARHAIFDAFSVKRFLSPLMQFNLLIR